MDTLPVIFIHRCKLFYFVTYRDEKSAADLANGNGGWTAEQQVLQKTLSIFLYISLSIYLSIYPSIYL